jgi:hypothetical protein
VLRQLNRPHLPAAQLSWIRVADNKIEMPSVSDYNVSITDAYPEYKRFQHLYYVQWRRLCGTYVATNVEHAMQALRPDHVAMLLSESMAIPLRSSMRIRETERVHSKRIDYELAMLSESTAVPLKSPAKVCDAEVDLVAAVENLKLEEVKPVFPEFPIGFFDGGESFRNFVAGLSINSESNYSLF